MAKMKNAKDLIEEGKKIMAEARKKQLTLIQEAKELEEKKFTQLGKKCVEFLEGKSSKEDLVLFAKQNGLMDESTDEAKNKQEEIIDV